jgi:hypothetical protein
VCAKWASRLNNAASALLSFGPFHGSAEESRPVYDVLAGFSPPPFSAKAQLPNGRNLVNSLKLNDGA